MDKCRFTQHNIDEALSRAVLALYEARRKITGNCIHIAKVRRGLEDIEKQLYRDISCEECINCSNKKENKI